ncbi:MAG: hypothetical protein JWN93_3200 [Hyphomicrobiales bacterium]|jgi:hypothetical protein|nr:hypothetical protein [Hyphomicrobiales bacterium]
MTRILLFTFLAFYAAPIGARAAIWFKEPSFDWWSADRSSAGLLPPSSHPSALVRIYAAPTVRWRGIFSVHSWIVLKDAGGAYERYDLTAWGDPIRVNSFAPDGRWFGRAPELVYGADGAQAEALIPRLRAAIEAYAFQKQGDYVAWPGPNSNTFVAAVMAAAPEMQATLPPNAVGKDYPHDGRWAGLTPSRTGVRLSLGGYAGLTLGWVEGLEVNLLGAVAGVDVRRPAIKLPAFGRIGMPQA